jgi:hypothetical protein
MADKMADQSPPPAEAVSTASIGYVDTFPAPGLNRTVRHITGHNAEGKAVFLSTDCGDHHHVMGEKQAITNIIYSTNTTPIEVNDDVDIKYAKENEVSRCSVPHHHYHRRFFEYLKERKTLTPVHSLLYTSRTAR